MSSKKDESRLKNCKPQNLKDDDDSLLEVEYSKDKNVLKINNLTISRYIFFGVVLWIVSRVIIKLLEFAE